MPTCAIILQRIEPNNSRYQLPRPKCIQPESCLVAREPPFDSLLGLHCRQAVHMIGVIGRLGEDPKSTGSPSSNARPRFGVANGVGAPTM